MKAQQVTSLLLCALLSSTLAHDYLHARHLSAKDSSSKLISPFENRALSSGEQCVWTCEESIDITTSLELYINSTTEIIAIYNSTAHIALVIDVNANIIAFFNGSSGDALLINIKTQTGIFINGSQTDVTWSTSRSCFKTFFHTLISLQIFFELNIGTTFSLTTVTHEILIKIGRFLVYFSASLALRIQQDINVGLQVFIKIGTTIITLLRGSLKGLLTFAGRGAIHIAGDIFWFVGVLEGLGLFFGGISGGLAALIAANVWFDLTVIFGASNGVVSLINLLLAIVARVNLSILGNLLGSVEKIIVLIVKLGGSVTYGLTGVFNVVWHLIQLINGQIKIDAFIEILVRFGVSRASSLETIDYSVYIEGFVKVIEIQSSTHGNCSQLTVLSTFVYQLQNGTLVIGGVNISKIITLLTATVTNVLKFYVSVLVSITAVVKITLSLPTLLKYLFTLLTSFEGIAILRVAVPGLNITISSSSSGNYIQDLVKNLNLQAILKIIQNPLKAFPVFEAITKAVSEAASSFSINFSTIIKSSAASSIIIEIGNLIKFAFSGTSNSSTTTTTTTTTTKSPVTSAWSIIGTRTWSWILP